MEDKLYNSLVEAMCNQITAEADLEELLVAEIIDADETVTDGAAINIARRLIDKKYVDAVADSEKLNREALEYYYEREAASRGW